MQNEVFKKFCHYVDKHIFSKENLGSYVSLIVDQSFVDDFCKENHTTEKALMNDVRRTLWNFQYDHLTIKGIVAIQLFAATKRANTNGLTVNNYRDRLSQVLDWEISDLQQWMATYQERIWVSLYKWCDNHYFQITKCIPRTGKGRYVQFPVNQALQVFTDEDLLYIAKLFVDNHLHPGEDITEPDFWKVINKFSISRYIRTRHAYAVISNSVSDEAYLLQIYNFYLRWNGKYKVSENEVSTDSALNDVYVYLTADLSTIEIRDENLKLLWSSLIDDVKYSDLSSRISFKRKGLLLFKKDDVYDNRWQEVRYIDADGDDYSKKSGLYGIGVCFREVIPFGVEYKMKCCEVLFSNSEIVIYKITRRISTEGFFTEKRIYELYGGFKIGRNTYLKGAVPILRLFKPSMVWIDGKAVAESVISGDYLLDNLEIGSHFIKLPNMKKIKLDVVEVSVSIPEWQDTYNKWHIGKKPAIWESKRLDQGIVGLDFSMVGDFCNENHESITRRWAEAFVFGKCHENENNIVINLINVDNGIV